MPYSNSAQAFGAVTVKTFQLKFELQTKENPVPFYDVNPQLFTHMEESGVFNNKMIIYVWLHNMFYIWVFFAVGNVDRRLFLISLTPINVTINILWVYTHDSPTDGGENAQKHIVG